MMSTQEVPTDDKRDASVTDVGRIRRISAIAKDTRRTRGSSLPDLTRDGADHHLAVLLRKWSQARTRLERQLSLLKTQFDGADGELVRQEMVTSDRYLQELLDSAQAIGDSHGKDPDKEVAFTTAEIEERAFQVKLTACNFLKNY